ncbi:hypothetical protein [Nocardia wallacei]|uniref:hypothetical protein n=1 Tax=Nocardia wallacei TaxID=480035 RepID=UPI002455CBC2|nr:hypothetical protein [Nocardia wallacei]
MSSPQPTPEQLAKLREQAPAVARAVSRITTDIQQLHRSIADGVFDTVGTPAEPARAIHHAIADRVYDSIRTIASDIGTAGKSTS